MLTTLRTCLLELQAVSPTGSISGRLDQVAISLGAVDRDLIGVPGLLALLHHPAEQMELAQLCEMISAQVGACEIEVERGLEHGAIEDHVEVVNAALMGIKDALWAISHDRLRNAIAIDAMSAGSRAVGAVDAFHAIQLTLSAIDRLEVRGRDSAGLHVLVRDHHLDMEAPEVRAEFSTREADALFCAGSVRQADGCLSFVYKTAAEIGELGDNTAALRHQISGDRLLRLALAHEDANALVVAHTRWASIGIISEPNTHPLNSESPWTP